MTAVQRERFLRPAEKTMQLSTLQCDSFRVSKFVIQTEKQDFFQKYGFSDFDIKKVQKSAKFALKNIAKWCIIDIVRSACTGV